MNRSAQALAADLLDWCEGLACRLRIAATLAGPFAWGAICFLAGVVSTLALGFAFNW